MPPAVDAESYPRPDTEVAPPRFAVGDPVRVRVAYPIGHCRTPFYFRGVTGVIERYCGGFPNPETGAYGRQGPNVHLYRVRARQVDTWPEYAGNPMDTIEVEIYEHWLEPTGGTDEQSRP